MKLEPNVWYVGWASLGQVLPVACPLDSEACGLPQATSASATSQPYCARTFDLPAKVRGVAPAAGEWPSALTARLLRERVSEAASAACAAPPAFVRRRTPARSASLRARSAGSGARARFCPS